MVSLVENENMCYDLEDWSGCLQAVHSILLILSSVNR